MLLTIRSAEPTDIAVMAELRAQTKGTQEFWTNRIHRYLRGEHSPQKALELRAAFVALDEGKIVGLVAGHLTRRFDCDGEVQWIDVDRQHRGRGIGYRLMVRMDAWFLSQHAKRICVNVDMNNSPARRLYEKCGARPLNGAWMVWDVEAAGSLAALKTEGSC